MLKNQDHTEVRPRTLPFEASIGPRNFLRGNAGCRVVSAGRKNCFNWATEFSPWKPATARLTCACRASCFNWATEFSPWKLYPPAISNAFDCSLQLGHGIFSVETRESLSPLPHRMGRLQLGHGIFSVETITARAGLLEELMLQLGHGIFSVETYKPLRKGSRGAQEASIGPRNFLRGNNFAPQRYQPHHSAASIGPRNFLRGNIIAREQFLQEEERLQLGHGIFSVETVHPAKLYRGESGASIGPRNFLRGNIYREPPSENFNRWLQLGHGIFSVETSMMEMFRLC